MLDQRRPDETPINLDGTPLIPDILHATAPPVSFPSRAEVLADVHTTLHPR